jgi:hypothetical protein
MNLDQVLNGSVRGFSGSDLIRALRLQPSMPLLLLMTRRIMRYRLTELDGRTARGRLLVQLLPEHACLGSAAMPHSFWLFPLHILEKSAGIAALKREGFDASGESSLRVVEPPMTRPHLEPEIAKMMLASTIYLPVYLAMPESEVRRMAEVLVSAGGGRGGPA